MALAGCICATLELLVIGLYLPHISSGVPTEELASAGGSLLVSTSLQPLRFSMRMLQTLLGDCPWGMTHSAYDAGLRRCLLPTLPAFATQPFLYETLLAGVDVKASST